MNPIIQHKFTADPTVLVHNDTVYLYTGHDEPPADMDDYFMNEWLCFSSQDLRNWEEHPSPLRATDFRWASGDAYASKVIKHKEKFYWFVSVTHKENYGKAIGVAIADSPIGPFTDYLGKALITHDMLPKTDNAKANLDPTIFIDENDQAHLFWGNGACYYAKLTPGFTAIESEIQTLDLPGFAEGAHIHYCKGLYYLSYGYGFPEKVAYATSEVLEGPWTFRGIINEIAGNCETNRPAIIEFRGNNYFFYHNGALPEGGSHRRSVCVDRLFYEEDGAIKKVVMTSEGLE